MMGTMLLTSALAGHVHSAVHNTWVSSGRGCTSSHCVVDKTWRTCGMRSNLHTPADLIQAVAHAGRAAGEPRSWRRHAKSIGAEELHVPHTSSQQAY